MALLLVDDVVGNRSLNSRPPVELPWRLRHGSNALRERIRRGLNTDVLSSLPDAGRHRGFARLAVPWPVRRQSCAQKDLRCLKRGKLNDRDATGAGGVTEHRLHQHGAGLDVSTEGHNVSGAEERRQGERQGCFVGCRR
jgi:hypothetical protein